MFGALNKPLQTDISYYLGQRSRSSEGGGVTVGRLLLTPYAPSIAKQAEISWETRETAPGARPFPFLVFLLSGNLWGRGGCLPGKVRQENQNSQQGGTQRSARGCREEHRLPELRKLHGGTDLLSEPHRRISAGGTGSRKRWGWERGPWEVPEEPQAVKGHQLIVQLCLPEE